MEGNKKKIFKKGNMSLYIDESGILEVFDGEKLIVEDILLSRVAQVFCDRVTPFKLCCTEGLLTGGGSMRCKQCFLGNITGQV